MQLLTKGRIRDRLVWMAIALSALAARVIIPPRPMDTTGLAALVDLFITLTLWIVLVLIHYSLGSIVLESILDRIQQGRIVPPLALPVGFGLSGSLISLLGLAGGLSELILIAYICLMAAVLGPRISPDFKSITKKIRALVRKPSGTRFVRTAKLAAIIIAVLSFINTLVPPWSYDALMYHLPGPDQFINAGRIEANPDNWYVNGPFLIEMVFTLGLSVKDAMIPKLIHWSFGVSLFWICFEFGKRWFDEVTAWFSVLVLLSIPIIPIISGFAYIDLGWAVFEFSGLCVLIIWRETGKKGWLHLSGLLIGLALSSKYIGLMGLAAAGLYLLFLHLRDRNFIDLPGNLLRFSLPVISIGGVWYLKNALIFGNPVYPLYFGGPGWDANRLDLYMKYLSQFGTGRRFIDLISLPITIYTRHEQFGAVFNRNDIPSLLFPITALLPFLRREDRVNDLIGVSILRMGLWVLGSHQIRFLLPVYALLALLTGYSIQKLVSRFNRVKTLGFFFRTLALGLTLITIFYQIQVLRSFNPLGVISGSVSKSRFLHNASRDFPAKAYLSESAPGATKVLLIGNGRHFYCQDICIPDPDHFRWSSAIAGLDSDEELKVWLAERHVSHILLSAEDLGFLQSHDDQRIIASALETLQGYREAGCLSEVYRDDNSTLYENLCQ